MLTITARVKGRETKPSPRVSDRDQVESGYHGGVAQSGLGELLRLDQLGLEASPEDARVGLLQNPVEGFAQHQVRVLNAQHVLGGGVEQTVPVP